MSTSDYGPSPRWLAARHNPDNAASASPPNLWLCTPQTSADDLPGPIWAQRTIEAFTNPGDRIIVRSLGGYPSLPGEAAALIGAAARAGRHPIALLPTPATAARTRALLSAVLPRLTLEPGHTHPPERAAATPATRPRVATHSADVAAATDPAVAVVTRPEAATPDAVATADPMATRDPMASGGHRAGHCAVAAGEAAGRSVEPVAPDHPAWTGPGLVTDVVSARMPFGADPGTLILDPRGDLATALLTKLGAQVRVAAAAPTVAATRASVGVGRRRPAREAGPATAVVVLAGPVAPGARPPRWANLSARVLAAWARPLRPGGILVVLSPAVIGRPRGRAANRFRSLASAARDAGLAHTEHIVLVHTPTNTQGLERPESNRRPHAPYWPAHTCLDVFAVQAVDAGQVSR